VQKPKSTGKNAVGLQRMRCLDQHDFENGNFHNFFLRLCVGQGCPTRGPHAAREVVLSGPLCNKFVSRLFKFLVFFYRLKYIYHQNTPKLYLLFLLWTYHPKTCTTNASKICQFFRFGLHPFKPATLRATIGLIITSCYRMKLIKIKRFVTSHSTLTYCYVTKNVCGPQ